MNTDARVILDTNVLLGAQISPHGPPDAIYSSLPRAVASPWWLDRLRKGSVRVSALALVLALRRIETVRGLGIKLPGIHVPPSRIAALARFASTVKVSA